MKVIHASGAGTNDSNDGRDVAVLSPSAPPSGSNSRQKDHEKHSSSSSPRRRSNRDVNVRCIALYCVALRCVVFDESSSQTSRILRVVDPMEDDLTACLVLHLLPSLQIHNLWISLYGTEHSATYLETPKSIRLAGVGKTAHTFYRRMHTLFFSNTNRKEYEALFVNGSRRRKRKSKQSESSNSSNPDEHEKDIRVERVTKPEEAPIYVIENFLTEKELEYFDEKIASIRFERSFVDNMGYNDENEDDDENDNNNDGDATHNCGPAVPNGVLGEEEKNSRADDSASQAEKQAISTGDERSEPGAAKSDAKKTGKKRKKRKRKTMIDDSHRTSTFYSFRKLHDAKISALERRIANILGCWVHQIEALQLVRYVPGQFFGIHHDLGNLLEDDNVQLPPKDWACKRRLVTMFCYLNTLQEDEGGCTYFPKCSNLRVRPKRGRAVLWCNITQDGKPDANTIHAGEAVAMTTKKVSASETFSVNQPAAGANHSLDAKCKSKSKIVTTKYGLNIWVCEE